MKSATEMMVSREALELADKALATAVPYVYNVETDPSNAPWRRETAQESMATIREARDRIAALLGT